MIEENKDTVSDDADKLDKDSYDKELEEKSIEELEERKEKRHLLNKLKLDSHFKMERFGFIMIFLSVMLTFVSIGGYFSHREYKKKLLQENVLYTDVFTFSKTENAGKVVDVFRNKENNRAYLIVKIEDFSLNNMSTKASNYRVFLLGNNYQILKNKPKGNFIVFGSSGYMCLELNEARGFEKEITNVIIRSNKDLKVDNDNNNDDSDNINGDSFNKYDQALITVNFGGDNVKKIKSFEYNSTSELYYTLIGAKAEQDILLKLKKDNEKIKKYYARILEFEDRIKKEGFIPPERPEYIEDDFKVPGYIDLDYKKTNLTEGYISKVLTNTDELSDYLLEKNEEMTENIIDTPNIESVKKQNGKELFLSTINSESMASEISVKQYVAELINAYSGILDLKINTQFNYMKELLLLDSNMMSLDNSLDINSNLEFK